MVTPKFEEKQHVSLYRGKRQVSSWQGVKCQRARSLPGCSCGLGGRTSEAPGWERPCGFGGKAPRLTGPSSSREAAHVPHIRKTGLNFNSMTSPPRIPSQSLSYCSPAGPPLGRVTLGFLGWDSRTPRHGPMRAFQMPSEA